MTSECVPYWNLYRKYICVKILSHSPAICVGSNACLNGGRCLEPNTCSCSPGYALPTCTGTSRRIRLFSAEKRHVTDTVLCFKRGTRIFKSMLINMTFIFKIKEDNMENYKPGTDMHVLICMFYQRRAVRKTTGSSEFRR